MTDHCLIFNRKCLSAYQHQGCRCDDCRVFKSAYDQNYREEHRDQLKTKRIQFRLEHPEIIRKWKKTDYLKHRAAYIERAAKAKQSPEGKIKHEGYRLKARYKVSLEERHRMYEDQKGLCAVCSKNIVGRNCHLDHDHASGKLRGLLCQTCNMGLGCFKDDISVLEKAGQYLKRYN